MHPVSCTNIIMTSQTNHTNKSSPIADKLFGCLTILWSQVLMIKINTHQQTNRRHRSISRNNEQNGKRKKGIAYVEEHNSTTGYISATSAAILKFGNTNDLYTCLDESF